MRSLRKGGQSCRMRAAPIAPAMHSPATTHPSTGNVPASASAAPISPMPASVGHRVRPEGVRIDEHRQRGIRIVAGEQHSRLRAQIQPIHGDG